MVPGTTMMKITRAAAASRRTVYPWPWTDAYETDADTVVHVEPPGVTANDSDADGDPLVVSRYDTVSTLGALVTIDPDGGTQESDDGGSDSGSHFCFIGSIM
jgi:hypothetical protein